MLTEDIDHPFTGFHDFSILILNRALAFFADGIAHPLPEKSGSQALLEELGNDHCVEIQSRLLSVASHSSPLEDIVQLIPAGVIIFEHSFYIFDKRRYLQDKKESDPLFHVTLEQYMTSPHAATVREAVSAAVQAYEEAMRTAIYPYQGKLPSWIKKLPFESFKRKAKEKESAKAEFIEAVLEIALNHRLHMFHRHIEAALLLIRLFSARP
ncbi:uncharacterized protein F5147DRAFT_839387 [Suillus discolor]|uniref:Uncharacterized protein n=1 Tax=Suillus discolor TaxID=1912936 RepID=A0A9P7JQN0_9AGAM|nr:uncharacterized protein F5147DRAFT_839387 [Suillus discolor]KAG2099562.1 hypothetical protein F5147DRAFT_839387 [Suillus discolor]